MHDVDTLLFAALQAAPRPYRMPALPASVEAAAADGTDTALAFAIEAARTGGAHAPAAVRDLFTSALADLIRAAADPHGGDPAFQALVLQAEEAEVREYVKLLALQGADRRAVLAGVDAVAHPGKLRDEAGAVKEALLRLHAAARAGAWTELRQELQRAVAIGSDAAMAATLEKVQASPALQRLERAASLLSADSVQRYLALCGQRGPLAGSRAASDQGQASARAGAAAEKATVQAFREIAAILAQRAGAAADVRVLCSLRPPGGFPGDARKAKDEWDVALVRGGHAQAAADIVLLAEVKASPAAATSDFSRLHRGLQRLAQADAAAHYLFASADGDASLSGASLRRLQPQAFALPPHVIYCCSAPAEARPPVLSAASKAVLLAEPASIAHARSLARGAPAAAGELVAVWDALATAPRLRSTLHQYDTARRVREAMVHPEELLEAVEGIA